MSQCRATAVGIILSMTIVVVCWKLYTGDWNIAFAAGSLLAGTGRDGCEGLDKHVEARLEKLANHNLALPKLEAVISYLQFPGLKSRSAFQ